MKTINRKIVTLALVFIAANVFAQPTPPGGGGGGGGGGSSSSYFPPNTNFFIGVQETNVVLNWRSSTNKIYLLEHRATLTGETQWDELTNYFLTAANTNMTTFVHTNIVPSQPMDFYRIFDVTPVARDDFYTVAQNSSSNQLGIFQNDSCPNDDRIYISNLIPAQHGDISYSLDASTFQYTPDTSFYGVDSFGYSITSNYGEDSTNATVTVFVNQSGNQPPTAPAISITLPTNIYTATFNALTNATDPDADTNTLFSVSTPSLGSVSNDANGTITYTRNPGLFGSDAFTYIVTDGKGGYGVCNVQIAQEDADGDGMPDQWELANGLDPASDDAMTDPDSDDLPNLAEFKLGVNPNAADNPLNLSGVTNGTPVGGFVQLPIIGLSSTIPTPPITFYVNGSPAANSSLWHGPDGQWFINWDTTLLTNGDYPVQLVCQVATPTAPDSIVTTFGSQKTLEVSNPIVFDQLTSKFTSFLLIYGKLAVTNSTYDIDLYDDDGNLLVYATGLSAANGQIALYWDLTDGNGNQLSFGNIEAVFTIHPPLNPNGMHQKNASNMSAARRWFLKETANAGGAFAVAWGWDVYSFGINSHREALMADGVINILGNPGESDEYFLLPVANVPYGGTSFRYDTDIDKELLFRALNDSGNFFWFGHGSDISITGNAKRSNVASGDVENLLGNKSFRSTIKLPTVDKHHYHLVILDGCETYSPDWAGAFGIDFAPAGSGDSVADYQYAGRPARAFVGWTQTVLLPGAVDYSGLLHAEYAEALANLFGYWMAGYPLNSCMQHFTTVADSYGFTGAGGNAESWKISGCVDLTRYDQ